MNTFAFKEGARIRGKLDPQVTGEALAGVRERHGGKLDPQAVVDTARNDNVLHGAFEWDDGIAGEAHRRAQARTLIRSIVIVVEPEEPVTPAFVHVRVKDEDGNPEAYYQDAEVAAGNPDERASVLRSLRGNISACVDSLSRFERMIGETAVTTKAKRSLEELREDLDD